VRGPLAADPDRRRRGDARRGRDPRRRRARRGRLTPPPGASSFELDTHARKLQDRGNRAAQHPLRRGRSDPPPLHRRARPGQRDREGLAAPEVAVRLRSDGDAIGAAARACDTVLRLLDSAEPNRPAYSLLCRYLALLDRRAGEAAAAASGRNGGAGPGSGRNGEATGPESGRGGRAAALAFRIKLALAAGFAPELGSCARCGEREGLTSFSGAAGGVVCASCEAGSYPISPVARRFMASAVSRPIAELPEAGEGALRQVERAIGDTLSHHAHVNLRAVA